MIIGMGYGMMCGDEGHELPYHHPGFTPSPSNEFEHQAMMRREQYLSDFPEHREKMQGRGVVQLSGHAPWLPEYW